MRCMRKKDSSLDAKMQTQREMTSVDLDTVLPYPYSMKFGSLLPAYYLLAFSKIPKDWWSSEQLGQTTKYLMFGSALLAEAGKSFVYAALANKLFF